jgi:hypothetical protein
MFRIADCHGETHRREPAASPFPVRTHPDVRRYPALLGQPDHVHCEYRGVRHDRHFSARTNSPAQGLNC